MGRLRVMVIGVMTLFVTTHASADESELEMGLAMQGSTLQRQGEQAFFAGIRGDFGYGLFDVLNAGGSVNCDRAQGIAGKAVAIRDVSGTRYYDSTRCAIIPNVTLRYGARIVGTVQAGAGYGVEVRSTRQIFSPQNLVLKQESSETVHELMLMGELGVQWRVIESLAVGAYAGVVKGTATEPVIRGGLRVSYFRFP